MSEFDDICVEVADLPLETRLAMLSGKGMFVTQPVREMGLPLLRLSDGPHGLRLMARDSASLEDSLRATCFPPAVALASTFDTALAERVGRAIGEEARAEGVHVVLGPGINLKRVPVCGRNFEYFSEDPLVSAGLAAAWIRGLQSQGVGASLKHFAVNNQETRRMSVSADVDERPLYELYLRSFMNVIADSHPWTVMCSYNRINGVWASENPWLLTTVLRDEWGYDGLVVSDWGAVVNRPSALRAGLDLQMPADPQSTDELREAYSQGEIDEEVLNRSAARLVQLMRRCGRSEKTPQYDRDSHHHLAREVARRAAVLLKNEGGILPLDPTAGQRIAVVGAFALEPRIQGSGSSRVVPNRLDIPFEELQKLAPAAEFSCEPGFPLEGPFDPDSDMARAAYQAAASADVVLAFLGNPESFESEGFDQLTTPALPQREFLSRLVATNPNVVVILTNGLVVDVAEWIDDVPAVFEGWLLGEAGGGAIADLLFGIANPSGRLAESIAADPRDHLSFANFPGDQDHVRYGEGLFVGYRGLHHTGRQPVFPFGHGLSYTEFAYGDLRAHVDDEGVHLTVGVSNTGRRPGHDVVQFYVAPATTSRVARPLRELKGFATVWLEPGEQRDITIHIPRRDLAYFDPVIHQWVVEGIVYRFTVGRHCDDTVLSTDVEVGGDPYRPALTGHSTMTEWRDHPVGVNLLTEVLDRMPPVMREVLDTNPVLRRMTDDFRMTQMLRFAGISLSDEEVGDLVRRANDPL